MIKKLSNLQFFHCRSKILTPSRPFVYLLHMFKVLFFSLLIFSVNIASASCELDETLSCVANAFKCSNLDPYSVSYTPTSGFPNENGEVQVNIEVRGSTYGGMVIMCNMKTDKFISFVSEYQEIGQN